MDYEHEYLKLRAKVREMLAAQKAYFKSRKDFQLLKKSKAIEKEVDDLVNPKNNEATQATFEWLAK